jgi:hypothetical protein
MKSIITAGTLIALTGCSNEPLQMVYQQSISTQQRGVALFDSGEDAMIGMESQACTVSTLSGAVGEDFDPSEDDETVHDSSGTLGGGGVTLVSNPSGVYRLEEGHNWRDAEAEMDNTNGWPNPSLSKPNVRDAALIENGFVALSGTPTGCDISRVSNGVNTEHYALTENDCSQDARILATDDGATTFVYGAHGLTTLTSAGLSRISDVGDVVAWNQSHQVLLVIDNVLQTGMMMTAGGTVQSTLDLPGQVTSAQTLDTANTSFALTLNTPNGSIFATLDNTHAMTQTTPIPEPSPFEISADGSRVAFVLPNQVHFFRILQGE